MIPTNNTKYIQYEHSSLWTCRYNRWIVLSFSDMKNLREWLSLLYRNIYLMVRCANGFTEQKSIKFQGYLSETDITIDLRHRTCENTTRQEKVISSVASVAVEPNPVLASLSFLKLRRWFQRTEAQGQHLFWKLLFLKKNIRTTLEVPGGKRRQTC